MISALKAKYNIGVVDDHSLLRTALIKLINSFGEFLVSVEAGNGKELMKRMERISSKDTPALVLLDIDMPEMDGFETARWLHKHYPAIKILPLSMFSDENTVFKILKLGAVGYLSKNFEVEELRLGLITILTKGKYFSEYVAEKLLQYSLKNGDGSTDMTGAPKKEPLENLTPRETAFLKLVCTDMTYSEIANEMQLSVKTVDAYREKLFQKLKVKTRVGLALFSLRNGLTN